MENMLYITGLWMLILPKMKWNILKNKLGVTIYCYCVGIYTLMIGIVSILFKQKIAEALLVICYMALLILSIIFIIVKLMKERNVFSKLMEFIGVLLLALSLFIACSDRKEITSSIIGLTGTIIMLSVPYDTILIGKEKKE